jgi:hypothetical protein
MAKETGRRLPGGLEAINGGVKLVELEREQLAREAKKKVKSGKMN